MATRSSPKSNRRESVVQSGVLAYLSFRPDCACWRQGVIAARFGNAYVKSGIDGTADILCVQAPTGRLIGIECKREVGGVLSANQIWWGEMLEAHGGKYIVARDVDDVIKGLGEPQVKVLKKSRRVNDYPR